MGMNKELLTKLYAQLHLNEPVDSRDAPYYFRSGYMEGYKAGVLEGLRTAIRIAEEDK